MILILLGADLYGPGNGRYYPRAAPKSQLLFGMCLSGPE